MTPKRAKELLPIIQSFADGEDVQFRPPGNELWEECRTPSFGDHLEYRIKPKPRLRPWTAKEAPLWAVLKKSDSSYPCLWRLEEGQYVSADFWGVVTLTLEAACAKYAHIGEDGTERPCGVVEDAAELGSSGYYLLSPVASCGPGLLKPPDAYRSPK